MTAVETPLTPRPGGQHRLTTAEAMVEGVAAQMQADPSVIYLGEDVGDYGGPFGSTRGLLDRFGPKRVIDTPASASAFVGLAVGAALEEMRPIAELRSVDFIGVCLDQVSNQMAKLHSESGGNVTVPMVLTAAVGGGYSGGAQHSQCLWGTFAHLPGMKVVVPSNPYDAKGLMISAIRDDNPVVYLFHKGVLGLSWLAKNPYAVAEVPDAAYPVPIGRAAVARSGTDVTVVTISRSVHHALEVADALAGQGIDVEVIDLRSLVPLDRDAIVDSVARTGRLVVVDEDYLSYGMSGEVAATVTDADPTLLRAPVHRVANPDSPIPYARELERAVLPGPERIEAAIRQLMAT
jgi:acetoin:2,6-dichlorophenolindophenol oxidoreductase subunit beta